MLLGQRETAQQGLQATILRRRDSELIAYWANRRETIIPTLELHTSVISPQINDQ